MHFRANETLKAWQFNWHQSCAALLRARKSITLLSLFISPLSWSFLHHPQVMRFLGTLSTPGREVGNLKCWFLPYPTLTNCTLNFSGPVFFFCKMGVFDNITFMTASNYRMLNSTRTKQLLDKQHLECLNAFTKWCFLLSTRICAILKIRHWAVR